MYSISTVVGTKSIVCGSQMHNIKYMLLILSLGGM
jgi:hypothetical protein